MNPTGQALKKSLTVTGQVVFFWHHTQRSGGSRGQVAARTGRFRTFSKQGGSVGTAEAAGRILERAGLATVTGASMIEGSHGSGKTGGERR
jgi:hypothetical protein